MNGSSSNSNVGSVPSAANQPPAAVIQNILIVGLVTIGNGFVGLYQMTSLASGAAQCPGTTAGAAADASVSPMVASVSS